MKTKIIYISGNEVFDMNDIRAAFEEVRVALNLDKNTVLFGVPVDEDDAGLMSESEPEITESVEPITQTPVIEEIIDEEPIVTEQPKRRGRPRKEEVVESESEPVVEQNEPEVIEDSDEKVVPILSILSTNDEPEKASEEIEIIPEISEEKVIEETVIDEPVDEPIEDVDEEPVAEDEADLEKLLSAMTPLQEDALEKHNEPVAEPIIEEEDDISVDATLEQLATEFAETQDKIATESKSASRSKIGKLRNILPFKQSKHKDQGLGDLFGWAGIAANDEDFSVPGFFTNAASKK